MEMPGLRPRGGAAGAAPFAQMPNAPQMRRVRAADQGPFDWLVPFIPPVLRVNRETREAIHHNVAAMLSMEALATALRKAALATKLHWRSTTFYIVFITVWVCGLVWIHHNETEFSVAYVILSGFAALGYHLLSGDNRRADGMSAYSVFNRGAQRMLGSLSAEQFENEIRHRQPGHEDAPDPEGNAGQRAAEDYGEDGDVYDADDPDLLAALQLSLQEKKREARRARRTSRRR